MDASQKLRVALIAGPMYDPLYQVLPEFTRLTGIPVEVAFHAVHPELNAHLASLNDVPYHLVSTHTKYAPSQLAFMGALDKAGLEDFFPALIEMTRINGRVYGIPRNIDIKLLHFRRDLVEKVPQTWDELTGMAASLSDRDLYGFVFPGKDSGLFGMFYELAEMGGAHLFPPGEVPKLNNQGGAWALGIIRNLYLSGAVPPENVEWQYDESHRFFRDGHAAMVCDWPGYYGAYCAADSKVHGRFGVARMPQGPLGIHRAYAGSHTFALTKRGTGEPAALDLLKFLTAPDRQWTEAQHGSVPVRRSVMNRIKSEATERWGLLEQVMASDMLIPPRLAYYPEIEEILWRTVRAAMTGEMEIHTALCEMESRIGECHARHARGEGHHAS